MWLAYEKWERTLKVYLRLSYSGPIEQELTYLTQACSKYKQEEFSPPPRNTR